MTRKKTEPAKKAAPKQKLTADEIAATPEYQALLADIIELIRPTKQRRTVWRPRVTMRDVRKAQSVEPPKVSPPEEGIPPAPKTNLPVKKSRRKKSDS